MPTFMVSCYVGGKSDGIAARRTEAKDALEAAEDVCGGSLIADGTLGQLRAVVSPLNKPGDKTTFRNKN